MNHYKSLIMDQVANLHISGLEKGVMLWAYAGTGKPVPNIDQTLSITIEKWLHSKFHREVIPSLKKVQEFSDETIFLLQELVTDLVSYFKQAVSGGLNPQHTLKDIEAIRGLTFEDASKRLISWKKHMEKSIQIPNPPEGSEREVSRFEGDYRIVEMLTPEALKREAALMGHCIADGNYDVALGGISGIHQYSLRDSHNKPIVTMEVTDGMLTQCEPKVKGVVLEEPYRSFVREFIQENSLEPVADNYAHGLIRIDGAYQEILDIKPDTCIPGDLDWSYIEKALPKGIHVEGDLIFRGKHEHAIPDGIKVDGDIRISSQAEVVFISPDFKLGGRIKINSSEALPLTSFRERIAKKFPDPGRTSPTPSTPSTGLLPS